ncbi:MAG TPA: GNAT family N-acetyltransferase [Mycobacteriales bacterium]
MVREQSGDVDVADGHERFDPEAPAQDAAELVDRHAGRMRSNRRIPVRSPEGVLEVGIVPGRNSDDSPLVTEIVELVNRVYAEAEKGLWRDGTRRTDARQVATAIDAGELALARLDDRIVGAVRIQQLDRGVGEFGMLVGSPEHRGVGIGSALVDFAETWARHEGLSEMQLELLVPRLWTHPVKEFLREWYTHIGYRQVRTGRLADIYPTLEPQLATPCDFVIYRKIL